MSEEQSSEAPVTASQEKALRRIEQIGFVLLVGTTLLFLGMAVAYPDPYSRVWSLVVAHVVGGRVGNVALGASGAPTLGVVAAVQGLAVGGSDGGVGVAIGAEFVVTGSVKRGVYPGPAGQHTDADDGGDESEFDELPDHPVPPVEGRKNILFVRY